MYFGIILSGLIAGYVGEHYGWQRAFFLFGSFGILLGIVFFLRVKKDVPAFVNNFGNDFNAESTPGVGQVARIIVRKPTVWMLTLAFACMVFVNVGYLTWMPSFLAEKFGQSLTEAGFTSLFYHHAGHSWVY